MQVSQVARPMRLRLARGDLRNKQVFKMLGFGLSGRPWQSATPA